MIKLRSIKIRPDNFSGTYFGFDPSPDIDTGDAGLSARPFAPAFVVGIALTQALASQFSGVHLGGIRGHEFVVLSTDVPPLLLCALFSNLRAKIDLGDQCLISARARQPIRVLPTNHITVDFLPKQPREASIPSAIASKYQLLARESFVLARAVGSSTSSVSSSCFNAPSAQSQSGAYHAVASQVAPLGFAHVHRDLPRLDPVSGGIADRSSARTRSSEEEREPAD